MALVASSEDFIGGAFARAETGQVGRRLGLGLSALLHGLAVILLVLVLPLGRVGLHQGIETVPVDVVIEKQQATPPRAVKQADPTVTIPREAAAPAQPMAAAAAASPQAPAPDALETKLRALAQLRAPEASIEQPAALLPPSDSEGIGIAIVKDIIRDQIERHWNLNLASLGGKDLSVPIRVKITSSGKVIEAEIVENENSADPVYRDIAISARNAILSASPLALPAGHYQEVMNIIVNLNPRDTLR